ncbi:MAG: hypothetical protein IPM18_09760 [Phycisphaerales bacterium]|nr:hypothetical protein [Phycisphaerales bacterium]
MQTNLGQLRVFVVGVAAALTGTFTLADVTSPFTWPALTHTYYSAAQESDSDVTDETIIITEETTATTTATTQRAQRPFLGVNRFFNIREAYSDVGAGQVAIYASGHWATFPKGRKDHFELQQSLLFGLTDDFHLELGLSEPLGYGGRGAPEGSLTLFGTFWHETDWLPAFGGSATIRIPTGYQSRGVDGTFTGTLTKTLFPKFRAHMAGFVETAHGELGYRDGLDRRHFQWGVGPGFDYQLTDSTLVLLNYLHRSSDLYGEHNHNILELGVVQELGSTGAFNHTVRFASEIGLDGVRDNARGGLKLQYGISW